MARGRPTQSIDLSKETKEHLVSITRSLSLPHGLVRRAKIILMSAEGFTNKTIAEKLDLSPHVIGKWRKRFLNQGLMGLYDETRPGGPRSISDEQIAQLIRKTLLKKPPKDTHWTCRSIAQETHLSKSTVQRVWKAFALQPHRQKHFKLSTDPFFIEKVRDIVGLYLNPQIAQWFCALMKKVKFKL